MPPAAGAPPSRRTHKRALATATLLVVAAIVAAAIVLTNTGDHGTVGTHRAGAFVATVQRRDLVTAQSETGTISYADSSTVANRLQGTLTWVPAVGRVISPGHRLFDVDDFPVVLMSGTTPAYRTLAASDSPGPDIAQLNANLIDLGFSDGAIVDEDAWQPATTEGVEAFQRANGLPETGGLTLGTIVFLNGARRVASLRGAAMSASDQAVTSHAEFAAFTPPTVSVTPTTTTETTTATQTTTATVTAPAPATPRSDPRISRLGSQVQRLTRETGKLRRAVTASRARRRAAKARPANPGPMPGGASPVMTTTSSDVVVTVPVPAGEQGVTHVGAHVPVVMPSGSTVGAHVDGIGQSDHGKVPITIRLDKREDGRDLDQAKVSVRFVQRVARHVLSVPVTALLARPGGGYAVQRAAAGHRLIGVHLGTFATGFVQVSGTGLHPGLKVTDSQG